MATYKMDFKEFAKYLEKQSRKYQDANKKFIELLANEATENAKSFYANAEYAGDNDVAVSYFMASRGKKYSATVQALGQATLFIEYGTGIKKNDAQEARAEIIEGNVLNHGEYGMGRAKNPNGWIYKGSMGENPPQDTAPYSFGSSNDFVHTYGNNATPAMYLSKKRIRDTGFYMKAAKEAFK